ncbi:TerB family tellurite resistance protein [Microbulbifer guangxiensis]|uniref:TerB family tellurite resistance protein n=1 Tax=Microbulbifer guangxiensis TaxID=2904249 RepID=UPI001F2D9713|nr:TerB family tellurite resistance protein [Microbulbifer guangxiensis]
MHIIIVILTALAGLIWALVRLQDSGVNLNSFNPFFWLRRHKWEKKLGTKPMHQLERPLEAAGLLLVSVAKAEGEITRELKGYVVKLFKSEFKLDEPRAAELFNSSSYMLSEAGIMEAEVKNILAPSKRLFTESQVQSLLHMLNEVACAEGDVSEAQRAIIAAVEAELIAKQIPSGQWG